MSRKIELTTRGSLINDIWLAEKRLREYDRFFDGLKKGKKMLEYGMYDDFTVEIVSWDKEEGTIVGKYFGDGGTRYITQVYQYGELHTEHRNLIF